MGRRSLFLRLAERLEGPRTLGPGSRFWIGAAVVLALAVGYRLVTDSDTVGNTFYFFNWRWASAWSGALAGLSVSDKQPASASPPTPTAS